MPSILPTTVAENPNFKEIVNYQLYWDGGLFELGQKFIRERIELNRHLPPQELKKLLESNLLEFLTAANEYLKSVLK